MLKEEQERAALRPTSGAAGSQQYASNDLVPGWVTTTVDSACPVCGQHGACRVHETEPFVCCVNVHSESPLTTGGWLHSDPLASSAPAPGWRASVREARSSFVSRGVRLRAGRSEA